MTTARVSFAANAPATPPPLSLYIHLPWCGRKCPYCDFNSHNAPRDLARAEAQYIAALKSDLTAALPAVWGRRLMAIFIGGGTPSLFSPAALAEILSTARALFNFTPDIEITMEANPDSSDARKFAAFRDAGVNRLSLGAQSFSDDALRRIGRLHDAAAARAAADAAARVFENFNIDLMHALPGQSVEDALQDITTAAEFAPAHLSLYQLTLEPGTPFARQPPAQLPSADAAADIADAVTMRAAALGYQQYEVSAYARNTTQRCRHNLNYWTYGDYIGIGAGAHQKITMAGKVGKAGKALRARRVKQPAEYIRRARAGDSIAEQWQVSADDAAFEFMLNAMRLTDGVSPALLRERLGGVTPRLRRSLEAAEAQGLLTREVTLIRPSEKGRRYLNDLTALFLPASNDDNTAASNNNTAGDVITITPAAANS